MAEAPDPPRDAGRRSRKVPDQGMDDRALDMSVLSRIEKWAPQDATVESFERVTVFGMPSESWTIVVTIADGTRATVNKDKVPPYARWFVSPGAVVPAVIDPKDPSRAQINWPELAERAAVAGGVWQEQPRRAASPPALVSRSGQVEEAPVASMGESFDLIPSAESVAAIEGITVERCTYVDAALIRARVSPQDHDAYATAQFEVPAGRWTPIRAQWQSRQMSDWKVGAAYDAAFEAAQKELKKRVLGCAVTEQPTYVTTVAEGVARISWSPELGAGRGGDGWMAAVDVVRREVAAALQGPPGSKRWCRPTTTSPSASPRGRGCAARA